MALAIKTRNVRIQYTASEKTASSQAMVQRMRVDK